MAELPSVTGGPVAIGWQASGRGPRAAEVAHLIWDTDSWNPRQADQECTYPVANAYRRHVQPTDEELERLMRIRTLYLPCFGYRRALSAGVPFGAWGLIRAAGYFTATAAATRAAFRR